jgi:hypothetical protein
LPSSHRQLFLNHRWKRLFSLTTLLQRSIAINITMSGSSWEEMPSGREQAIETLVDMDDRGSLYRASRVLVSLFLS